MASIRKRQLALMFWALVVAALIVFGAISYFVLLLVAAVCFELFALGEVRRYGDATDPGLLLIASLFSIVAAILLVVPTLIEQALGDQVYACFGDTCGDESGTNIVGGVLWVYLLGLALAAVALVAWIGYVVKALRQRRSGATPVNPTE